MVKPPAELMPGMAGGEQRPRPTLVQRGEKVAIFGDYDVDGATSAALLTRFLRAKPVPV